MNKIDKINELISLLNKASFAYYSEDMPIMADKEYDDLYDELCLLEKDTGIVLASSPTQKVQGYVIDGLKKVKHSKPMLSADKTKSADEISSFVAGNGFYTSFKLDGLTLVVIYEYGVFKQGITRGSGTVGENVTEQCRFIGNLPMKIPYKQRLELRGECVISWNKFNRINENLNEPYSHPRNLAAGTLRQLDLNVVRNRSLSYVVFECVSDIGEDSKWKVLNTVERLGFEVVKRSIGTVRDTVERMKAETYKYPVDGLIYEIDSNKKSKRMGSTSHHECCRMALKWEDTLYETVLRDIEWNTTKTGTVNPVAIFDPVDLEGAITTRATLHNVSIIEKLELGIGDTIQVYRSNMVIPKVHNNLTRSNLYQLPNNCPCCGGEVEICNENGSKTLRCINPSCSAKLLSRVSHFVSKKGMDIEGLSEATLEKFINLGWIKCLFDVYNLGCHYGELINMEGFGIRSVEKLEESIEKSKDIELKNFIAALSIPNIGTSQAKELAKTFATWDDFESAGFGNYDFTKLDGFGDVLNKNIHHWFHTMWNEDRVGQLVRNLHITNGLFGEQSTDSPITGKVFVITGSLEHFGNRKELQELIEKNGGKVTGSVTSKTDFLINNDLTSGSSKNIKAKKLGVSIISEQNFLKMIRE